MSFNQIISDIKQKSFSPVYLLMGEEPFFIDAISDLLESVVVEEDMKGFNEHIMYGLDSDPDNIIGMAKSYPMMGDRQLVMIKEAQSLKGIQNLEAYVKQPLESTVLVLCHKYKKVDKRSALYKAVSKVGVAFDSEKIRDYQLGAWIKSHAKELNLDLDDQQANLLADYLGVDLSKVSKALQKLKLIVKDAKLTNEDIQKHIGISKEYNIFEMQLAVLERNFQKSLKITNYFVNNPKSMHIIPAIGALYNVYTKWIKLYYSKDKSPNASFKMGISKFMLPKYTASLQKYSLKKVVYNLEILKEYDLKAKGLGASGADQEGIFMEMMQKLML